MPKDSKPFRHSIAAPGTLVSEVDDEVRETDADLHDAAESALSPVGYRHVDEPSKEGLEEREDGPWQVSLTEPDVAVHGSSDRRLVRVDGAWVEA